MAVGILALQGAFAEHETVLNTLGTEYFEIRQLRDLQTHSLDALIIPGGESTVMGKLLRDLGLFEPILDRINAGMPVFGTCAGLILLAETVEGGEVCFGTMDISVKRNAYGRQLGSFYAESEMKGLGVVPMTFIRAPYIISVGSNAECLAEVDGHIVAARQGNQLVTAFHPELCEDVSVHKMFLNMIRS